jgi:hypothetical protein
MIAGTLATLTKFSLWRKLPRTRRQVLFCSLVFCRRSIFHVGRSLKLSFVSEAQYTSCIARAGRKNGVSGEQSNKAGEHSLADNTIQYLNPILLRPLFYD